MIPLPNGFPAALAMGSFLFTGAVFGSPVAGILIGDSFTLPAQQTYSGNLVAMESAITIEPGAVFSGNLVLIGGSLESAGKINGDIAALDSPVHFAATATMHGTMACLGSAPELDPGAEITGTVQTVEGIPWPLSRLSGDAPGVKNGGIDFGYEVSLLLFRVFLLSAVSTLIVLFLPGPAERVARTIIVKPAVSFLLGLLTMMAAVALFLLLALTVCLSPVSVLGSVVLLVAVLLGWSALGWNIGRQVFRILGAKAHPAVMAGTGTAILTLAASAVGYLPLAGPLLILLALSFTLGAVVLTRFGGQGYLNLPKVIPPDLKSS
jgi:hypothetical protein